MPERPDAAGNHWSPDRLITPKDAADRLAVSPSTVLLWLKTGQLRGVKAGKLWRIRERAIDEFLKEPEPLRKTAPVEEPVRAKEPAPREMKGRDVGGVMNWKRYDALKARGLSQRQIADELGIPRTTLQDRLKKRQSAEKHRGSDR
jgi:excisionase family DNA binding protein